VAKGGIEKKHVKMAYLKGLKLHIVCHFDIDKN